MRLSRRLYSIASPSSVASTTSTSSSSWDYDVMICGGGIVGAALASKILHMTGGTVKIGVIEPKAPESLESCQKNPIPDRRVYALSPRSIELLKSVNAWEMISTRTRSYEHMQIWEMNGQGMLSFSSKDMNVPELGRIVEDRMIQTSLFESFKDYSKSVDCLFNSTVTTITIESSSDGTFFTEPALLTYSTTTTAALEGLPKKESKTVKCRLVVGADGGNSAVRRLMGIPSWGWSYGQTAVVSTVTLDLVTSASVPPTTSTKTTAADGNNKATSSSVITNDKKDNSTNDSTDNIKEMNQHNLSNTTAFQTYLPTGPLALLPLWGNKASIVWSLPTPLATHMMKLSPHDFATELNRAFQTPFSNQFKLTQSTDNNRSHHHYDDNNSNSFDTTTNNNNSSNSNNFYATSEYNMLPTPQKLFQFINNTFTNSNNKLKNPFSKIVTKVSDEMIGFINTMADVSGFRHPFQSPPLIETTGVMLGERAAFPLTLQQASRYVAPRMALVGDAAHSIHPQAGQGLNMGLQDVDALAKVIVDGLASGSDIGSMQVLNKYGPASYYRNLNMLMVVNTINNVFSLGKTSSVNVNDADNSSDQNTATPSSTSETFFRNTRSLGLIGINSFDILKKTITKYAMGV